MRQPFPHRFPRRLVGCALACLILASLSGWRPVTGAVQTNLDLTAIDDALTLVRSGTRAEHDAFNRPYRVTVTQAPVDYVEVVTPFRRIVLAGAARVATGDRSFGQRDAIDLLATSGARVDIYAELTFHPLNNFIGVPPYEIGLVTAAGRRLEAIETTRLARWTPRLDGPPPVPPFGMPAAARGVPLLGATVVGGFDLARLEPSGRYDVVITVSGGDPVRTAVSLGGMR